MAGARFRWTELDGDIARRRDQNQSPGCIYGRGTGQSVVTVIYSWGDIIRRQRYRNQIRLCAYRTPISCKIFIKRQFLNDEEILEDELL